MSVYSVFNRTSFFRSAVPFQRQLWNISHEPNTAQPDPPRRAVVATRRLQMAEETLSAQLPGLRGGVLPARHHRLHTKPRSSADLQMRSKNRKINTTFVICSHFSRPGPVASERGEAGEDGAGAGNTSAGVAAAGAAAPGAGGGTQLAAAQQR